MTIGEAMTRLQRLGLTIVLLMSAATPGLAGEADVIDVTTTPEAGGTWRFDVTVRHADEGWDHYADKWEVLSPEGKVLATRVLVHPHETEQPFTRSLGGVSIPAGIDRVIVRAHDSVHLYGGAVLEMTLD
jgi:hypothetical protein